jgi:hypothetical protein
VELFFIRGCCASGQNQRWASNSFKGPLTENTSTRFHLIAETIEALLPTVSEGQMLTPECKRPHGRAEASLYSR